MKKVTKNNILMYIKMRKEYEQSKDKELLKKINNFIEEVINKDKQYYSKIYSYNLTDEELKYCLW